MANQDIFKQAIAEAKSIREAAISNARDVLEESLTPHLKDMLAAKLQEMEEEEMDETYSEEEEMDEAKHSEEEMEEGQGNIDADGEEDHDQLEEKEEAEEVAEAEEEEPAEDDSEKSEDEAGEEEAEEEVEIEDMELDDLRNLIRDIVAQELGHSDQEPEMGDEEGVEDMVASDEEEEIDLDELIAELEKITEGDVEEEVTEVNEEEEEVTEAKEEDEEEVKENAELNEALSTIETLRKELSEVNLLNSKLLYVNKIFKAHNLTESQKVNVISAFDKAETVKEVKLVYETVSENITTPKQSIKEHKSFASKASGNSTKGEIISEVSDQVRRMQKLAGII